MPINTDITTISQNPALNGPDGSDAPSLLDDAQRHALSFIAKLRDGVGFAPGALNTGLGFVPVRQYLGGTISIGWTGEKLAVKVDALAYGTTWPIDISGNAVTATTAVTAGSANTLAGVALSGLVRSGSPGYFVELVWDPGNYYVRAWVDGIPQYVYTHWGIVQDRPTDLGQFTNGPGFVTSANVINRIGAVTGIGNSGSTALTAQINGFGAVAWGVTPCDGTLKRDIEDSTADPLSKVARIRFVSYRFRDGIDDGRRREGAIAQQLQDIDPNWVNTAGTYLAPNNDALVMEALHSVQKLLGIVQSQAARIAALEATR